MKFGTSKSRYVGGRVIRRGRAGSHVCLSVCQQAPNFVIREFKLNEKSYFCRVINNMAHIIYETYSHVEGRVIEI